MEAFKYGCIVDGENFCARPELSRQLANYISSGQNVVIQGERRIGKSSLVRAAISGMRGQRAVFADFMGVRSVTDVCNRIADALARFDSEDSLYRKTLALLSHLRPIVTVDAMTGQPTITVDAAASRNPASVNAAMDALAQHVKGRKVCIVFDEFQDILDVRDGEQIFALMRARIQCMPRTCFAFLGSARNSMLSIFLSPKSPFYKSAIVFDVGEIPDDDFYAFSKGRFAIGRRKIPRETFDRILDFVNRVPGDVQELCDAIWQVSAPGDTITVEMMMKGIDIVFARESGAYVTFVKPLTDIQLRVLRALATLGGEHPLSGEFLRLADVSTPTTIKRSLTSLAKAELIYDVGGGYKFVSPFFREWIRRRV